jgi:hypothetical protein
MKLVVSKGQGGFRPAMPAVLAGRQKMPASMVAAQKDQCGMPEADDLVAYMAAR